MSRVSRSENAWKRAIEGEDIFDKLDDTDIKVVLRWLVKSVIWLLKQVGD